MRFYGLVSCQHKNKILEKGIGMNADQLTDQWFLGDQGSFMLISHCFSLFLQNLEVSEAGCVVFL